MRFLSPDVTLLLFQVVAFAFYGLLVVTIIKLLKVLFKVDRFIDEFRDYLRKRT